MAETDNPALTSLLAALRFPQPDAKDLSEDQRQALLGLIEHQRTEFERHGNPLCAWQAYLHAREAGVATPEWVLKHLDQCASGMWELWQRSMSGETIDHAMVANVFGVAGQQGKPNAFSDFGSPDWMVLAEMVGRCLRLGDQETYAIDSVAEGQSTSASTVRRAWMRYQAEYPERANEFLSSTKPPIS